MESMAKDQIPLISSDSSDQYDEKEILWLLVMIKTFPVSWQVIFFPQSFTLHCFIWNFWQIRTKHPLKNKENHVTSGLKIKQHFFEVHFTPIKFWNLNLLDYNILDFRNILLLNIGILFSHSMLKRG